MGCVSNNFYIRFIGSHLVRYGNPLKDITITHLLMRSRPALLGFCVCMYMFICLTSFQSAFENLCFPAVTIPSKITKLSRPNIVTDNIILWGGTLQICGVAPFSHRLLAAKVTYGLIRILWLAFFSCFKPQISPNRLAGILLRN